MVSYVLDSGGEGVGAVYPVQHSGIKLQLAYVAAPSWKSSITPFPPLPNREFRQKTRGRLSVDSKIGRSEATTGRQHENSVSLVSRPGVVVNRAPGLLTELLHTEWACVLHLRLVTRLRCLLVLFVD